MLSLLSLLFTLGCSMSSALTASGPPRQAAAPVPADPFPAPREGLKLAADLADGGPVMLDVVNEFSRVTGQTLVIDPQTRMQLQTTKVGLNQDIAVPPDQVYFVVETLLVQRDFALVRLNDREPRMLALYSLAIPNALALRGRAVFVRSDESVLYSRHPALLITTSLDLPYTDVRTLSNSMRSLFQDANTQQIIPVGNTNTLILTGTGSNVFALVEMLRAIDDAARRQFEHRATTKPEKPAPDEKSKEEEKPQDPKSGH
ncbi:MAG: hypothetical protein ACKVWV_10300 [Planctomycetota bacterium]